MYLYVHWSIIHNGQDLETTEVYFNRGLHKEDVVHIYYGMWGTVPSVGNVAQPPLGKASGERG